MITTHISSISISDYFTGHPLANTHYTITVMSPLYSDGPGGVSNQMTISKLTGIVELNTLCASLLTKEFIRINKARLY